MPEAPLNPRHAVTSCEEEWRTRPREYGSRHGVVMLWVGLACGHYVQRKRALRRDGNYDEPKHLRCEDCAAGISVA